MLHRLVAVAVALLLAGGLSACGDDTDTSSPADTGTTPSADAPDADEGSNDDGDPAAGDDSADDDSNSGDSGGSDIGTSGDAGTATIAGTTYGFDQALRCDVDSLDIPGVEREIEAQFLGGSGGDRVQLDVYVETIGGMPSHQISWNGPEGLFSNSFTEIGGSWMGDVDDVYQDSPVVIDGDRATGSVVLYDAFTMEDTIELDFDVAIPTETFACR